MPLAVQGLRPTPLRRRASRPQLKRDPLGGHDHKDMTSSLEAFVRDRLAETAISNPGLYASLQEVGGMLLLGTIGIEVALKPDGSVWVREEEISSLVVQPWRIATTQERLGFLKDASEKWPELRSAVPARPSGAPSCDRCKGSGYITQRIICPRCRSLGWLVESAA